MQAHLRTGEELGRQQTVDALTDFDGCAVVGHLHGGRLCLGRTEAETKTTNDGEEQQEQRSKGGVHRKENLRIRYFAENLSPRGGRGCI